MSTAIETRSAAAMTTNQKSTWVCQYVSRTRRQSMRTISVALFVLVSATAAFGQVGVPGPSVFFAGVPNNTGGACSGCKVYTYAAGTSTPEPTYSDVSLSTPNANPIILDSAGRATVFLSATSYKFVLRTSADVLLWTFDNYTPSSVSQTQLGEFFYFGGDSTSPITATSYAAGATVDKTHAGTSLFSVDSADIPAGTYVLEGMLIGTGGATVTAALVNLSDGSPDTPMVTISSASTTGARVASSSVTFAASGTAKAYGIKSIVTTGGGFVWGLRLRRTG